ncbi:plasmid stabilization protein [Sphingomonas humi]|uniref:Plasmid stabilization protein n=1 Tax=Sphingomonas humi TaxID=335630 RepID=A0ABP7RS05_9SPHN
MPQGDKGAYTDKQRRKARDIEQGYEKQGRPAKEAERIAWATVNKQDGGGKDSGSGRARSRSEAAKKGWETRRKRAAK